MMLILNIVKEKQFINIGLSREDFQKDAFICDSVVAKSPAYPSSAAWHSPGTNSRECARNC